MLALVTAMCSLAVMELAACAAGVMFHWWFVVRIAETTLYTT